MTMQHRRSFSASVILVALLLTLSLAVEANQQPPRRHGNRRLSLAVASGDPRQAACQRDCQAAVSTCCQELGYPACDVTCARGRFLCGERCGDAIRPCQRSCFLSMFDCFEDCAARGLSKAACDRQCNYYNFTCLLNCTAASRSGPK